MNKLSGISGCIDDSKTWSSGCFFLVDACHFYRVYAYPISPTVLEVFKCDEFQKELELKITLRSLENRVLHEQKLQVVGQSLGRLIKIFENILISVEFTALSPINAFERFVTDGETISELPENFESDVTCPMLEDAYKFTKENCAIEASTCINCAIQVDRVNCVFRQDILQGLFKHREHVLPILAQNYQLLPYKESIKINLPTELIKIRKSK